MDQDLESSQIMPRQMINPSENFLQAATWLNQVAEKLGPTEEAGEIKQIANSIRLFKLWQDAYVSILEAEHLKIVQDLQAELDTRRLAEDSVEWEIQLAPTPPETRMLTPSDSDGE